METVTWVLQGSLVHQDSEGNHGVRDAALYASRLQAGGSITVPDAPLSTSPWPAAA